MEPRSVLQPGKLEKCLRWISVRPGDVIYIPAGTVHALGPGIQCYEIQQSSDVTYRLWDWGRTGPDGRPRELHVRQALDVISPGMLPGPVRKKAGRYAGGTTALLVDDPHFQLSSVDLDGSFPLPSGRMLFLTPFSTCTVCWNGHSQQVAAFRSVLIPARLSGVTVTGSGRMLMARAM